MFREFIPKSYLYLRSGYRIAHFKKDLAAGVAVGIIALPLAMAFAISSGVPPEKGIFTAIVAGFLISALGGSAVQIGGPTGAFVVIIYEIIQRNGYQGLAVSTLIASVLLVLFGLFRLGSWIKYVPHPLIAGFTSAIGVMIFSSQMKDFFGLQMGPPPSLFIEKWKSYYAAFPSLNLTAFWLGGATLLLIIGLKRFFPKIPWGIGAIGFATLCSYFFELPVETIQSAFGGIPQELPKPSFPSFYIPEGKWGEIGMDAIAIAFLIGIEALLSAVIADGMLGTRHRSNSELVGQGIGNFASILFGGIPATGAIARTAANVKNGGQTPVAGMIHALTLLGILFFFAPLASQIPLTALAAVLIVVAWNMAEIPHFISLLKGPVSDGAVLLTVFILTIFVDITVSISFGMILSSFLFMKRMSECSRMVSLTSLFQEPLSDFPEREDRDAIEKKKIPKGIEVFELEGPFFFGAADMLKDLLAEWKPLPKGFILRMRKVPFIDASGMHALKEFHHKCKKKGILLLLSGVEGETGKDLEKYGVADLIGKEHIFPHIDQALRFFE